MSDSPVQVDSTDHYFTPDYASPQRFFSWGLQVQAILKAGVRSVLEVGPGPGIVSSILRDAGLDVVTLDVDPRLKPDAVGDVLRLPVGDGAVEAVICCQVLEHLPYAGVEPALVELRRVATRLGVLSVPDVRPFYYVEAALPKLRFHRRFRVPWARKLPARFDGEHHWSLGLDGYPVERLVTSLRAAGWRLRERRRPLEHAYHHFFLVE